MTIDDSFKRVQALIAQAKPLGYRALEDGTQLFGHVPYVAPDAWLHIIFRPLLAHELQEIEGELGRPLPDEYARFLKHTNGLSLFSGALSFDGFRTDYTRRGDVWQPFSLRIPNLLERPRAAPGSAFFIGGYSYDGSLLFIDEADGVVRRCDRDFAVLLNEWSDLSRRCSNSRWRG